MSYPIQRSREILVRLSSLLLILGFALIVTSCGQNQRSLTAAETRALRQGPSRTKPVEGPLVRPVADTALASVQTLTDQYFPMSRFLSDARPSDVVVVGGENTLCDIVNGSAEQCRVVDYNYYTDKDPGAVTRNGQVFNDQEMKFGANPFLDQVIAHCLNKQLAEVRGLDRSLPELANIYKVVEFSSIQVYQTKRYAEFADHLLTQMNVKVGSKTYQPSRATGVSMKSVHAKNVILISLQPVLHLNREVDDGQCGEMNVNQIAESVKQSIEALRSFGPSEITASNRP